MCKCGREFQIHYCPWWHFDGEWALTEYVLLVCKCGKYKVRDGHKTR